MICFTILALTSYLVVARVIDDILAGLLLTWFPGCSGLIDRSRSCLVGSAMLLKGLTNSDFSLSTGFFSWNMELRSKSFSYGRLFCF